MTSGGPGRRHRSSGSRDGEGDEAPDAGELAARSAFERAVAEPSERGAAHGDGATLAALREAEVRAMGRVVYSSNAVFLVEFDAADPTHPGQPLRAVYKPARGERPLWDFPRHTLHLREVGAYLVSAALGDRLVPPTTLRDGPHGPGSVQHIVHRATSESEAVALPTELRALAALDVLLNNADRKRAHLLLGDDGHLRGIDNALSFLPYPRQRTVLIDLGGSALPRRVRRRVEALAGDAARRTALCAHLRLLLAEEEVAAFEARLVALAATGTYPVLDPWDGRPFEWW
ncbi:MAG: protein kinase family protein [Candidatus Dormibacteria bacterium]